MMAFMGIFYAGMGAGQAGEGGFCCFRKGSFVGSGNGRFVMFKNAFKRKTTSKEEKLRVSNKTEKQGFCLA